MTLKEKIAQLAQQPEPEDATTSVFVQALEEFAEAVADNHPWVNAWVEEGRRVEVWYFKTAPRYRPRDGTVMIGLHDEGNYALIFGEGERKFQTREELDEYLIRFYKGRGFQQTLQSYKEIGDEEPAIGVLRVHSLDNGVDGDTSVMLEPAEHKRLVDAEVGAHLELMALLDSPYGEHGGLRTDVVHRYLNAEGVGMRLEEDEGVEQIDDKIVRLRGTRMADDDRGSPAARVVSTVQSYRDKLAESEKD